MEAIARRTEIYADKIVFELAERSTKVRRILYGFVVSVPLIYSLSRMFHWTSVKEFGIKFDQSLAQYLTQGQLLALTLLPAIIMLIAAKLPAIVRFVRQQWLYPKASFTQQANLPIVARKFKNKPGENHHYLTLKHPVSQQDVTFEIDKKSYFRLKEGDYLRVKYSTLNTHSMYVALNTFS